VPQDTKFDLSNDELNLLSDSHFLLEKRVITEKIVALLGNLDEEIRSHFKANSAPFLTSSELRGPGKISRGENLHGLPYLILDQPSIFTPEGTLALRVLFWWGNYFLISFQASGNLRTRIAMLQLNLLDAEILYLDSEDLWEARKTYFRHFKQKDINIPSTQLLIENVGFLKLGLFVPLTDYRLLSKKTTGFIKSIQNAIG